MKKIVAISLAVSGFLACCSNVNAQALQFLTINPDARVMSMANTGTVAAATAFSMFNNTAATALASNERTMDVGVSYGMWQPGYSANHMISAAGYGKITRFMTIAAGVRYFTHGSYDITDEFGAATGTFAPKDIMAGIGLGFKILPILSLSANVNYIMSQIAPSAAGNAVSADFGAIVDLKFLRVGVTASNIGSKIKYAETPYSLPANAKLGVGTTRYFGRNDKSHVSVNVQAGMLFVDSDFFAEAGVEYCYNDLFRISAGYHYGKETSAAIPSYVTAGLGIKLFGVYVNAAYLTGLKGSSPLNNTFQIGLGYTF